MSIPSASAITVETAVNAPIEKVWDVWTNPKHIVNWNNASPDWHTPHAENDLRKSGKFTYTMAAKNGSFKFDFEGVYFNVEEHKIIEYTIADGRKVKVNFTALGDNTKVVETFDPENQNSAEMQRAGWQAILNNFKTYAEENQ
ncbi:MAG: SRPBCC family protein [Bacteroidota bacterium]